MKTFSRFWHSILSAIPIFYLLSCTPDTAITKKFDDKGGVEYTFTGTVPIGSITGIKVKFNNNNYDVNDGDSKVFLIIKGANTLEATAYANGTPDPTPAPDSFDSLSEQDARSLIDGILSANSAKYKTLEKDVLLSAGISDNFSVDYLITKLNGTDAIINYVGYEDNLNKEISNQEVLNALGVSRCYLFRIPEAEIRATIENFISGGFN